VSIEYPLATVLASFGIKLIMAMRISENLVPGGMELVSSEDTVVVGQANRTVSVSLSSSIPRRVERLLMSSPQSGCASKIIIYTGVIGSHKNQI